MTQFIINADDFGLTKFQTSAIAECFRKGYISSATICANGDYFNEALCLLRKENLNGKVGAHINITEGKPLTKEISYEPFFCSNGFFHARINRFKSLNKEQKKLLYCEISAQLQRIADSGINITHIDSHHHIHTAIYILPIFLEAMKQFKISKIRIYKNLGCDNFPKMIGKDILNELIKRKYVTTDFFGDSSDFEKINSRILSSNYKIEIMVHPDYSEDHVLIDKVYTKKGLILKDISQLKENLKMYEISSYCDI